jgi:hypothetical protein
MKESNPFKTMAGHVIVPAIKSGGVQYYQFNNIYQMSCLRALTALDYYDEFNQRVDREYLLKHTEAVNKILSDPKSININKLAQLNRFLEERTKFIFDADLAYKLASVMFFDESENPYFYDHKYGQTKIEKWKKDMTIDAFFLQQPLMDLMPCLKHLNGSTRNYSQIVEKVKSHHAKYLSEV